MKTVAIHSKKRQWVSGLSASVLLALGISSTQAQAQSTGDWPKQPIKIVVGFAPGTAPDIFARLYGQYISSKLGVPVVVDSKPGAAGNLSSDIVAKAPGDGYTLLYNLSTGFTINPYIYSKLPFNPEKDLTPVATTMRQGLVLITQPNGKHTNLKDFVAGAKAKPGQLTHGSYGAGSPSHLIAEWFKEQTKTFMVHVPYRANPMSDLLGGQVDVLMEPLSTGYPMISTGKAVAIAYSGPNRHPLIPNVPTFSEAAPEVAMMSWHGIWAPSSTPPAILNRLNALFIEGSKDPVLAAKIRDLSSEPLGLTRAEMTAAIKRDADIYGRIAKEKNIKVD